jgi:hypothetical protein
MFYCPLMRIIMACQNWVIVFTSGKKINERLIFVIERRFRPLNGKNLLMN